MILLQSPPPPPMGFPPNNPFAPCNGQACVPIDDYWVVLLFIALCFGMFKLIHYEKE